ncbi:RagB/SusD family nutrient uptake outer membrane protein [Niabella hibiscisoli]|uniref:RagB/SusD family nutrient uptake outer membrane protein n=1 Tax=Niabella hibiscisoli TaxID=1825928 RepID=UPI001F0EEEE3|nr:RagB/SusD family nutrient uptake outer membrane protein [Niabella hibiscisoli]MCH5717984.1 RagB/SusD family nutrient uptake outer membrane protein [Niabella hibiscisoli]
MKKDILIRFLLATLIMVSLAGCNKWLDLKPRDGIVGDEFWQTKEQVDAAVTGIYASIQASTVNGGRALTDYMFVWGEARADMVTIGNRTSPDEQDMININMTPIMRFPTGQGFTEPSTTVMW